MRTPILLLAVTVLLGATAAALAVLPGAADDLSRPHPAIDGMLVGGGRPSPSELAFGWLFGTLQILMYAALVALGARRRASLARPLAAATGIYVAVWTALVAVFAWSSGDAIASVGLTPATGLLLFALWPAPVGLVALYVFGFERWVFGPQEQARLHELVERASNGPDHAGR